MAQQTTKARVAIERRPQVESRTGLSRTAIYAGMAAGEFPRPVRLGAKAVGWRSDEIDAWIDSRQRAVQGGAL